jgi:hypothetical protein
MGGRAVSRERRRRSQPEIHGEPIAAETPAASGAPRQVAVLLKQPPLDSHPGDGYEPLSGYITAVEFVVDATSALAACEIAYAVTNSTPDDMHCPARYRDVVETYRDVGHFRSVSVDDILEVDRVRYACARFGFTLVPA